MKEPKWSRWRSYMVISEAIEGSSHIFTTQTWSLNLQRPLLLVFEVDTDNASFGLPHIATCESGPLAVISWPLGNLAADLQRHKPICSPSLSTAQEGIYSISLKAKFQFGSDRDCCWGHESMRITWAPHSKVSTNSSILTAEHDMNPLPLCKGRMTGMIISSHGGIWWNHSTQWYTKRPLRPLGSEPGYKVSTSFFANILSVLP